MKYFDTVTVIPFDLSTSGERVIKRFEGGLKFAASGTSVRKTPYGPVVSDLTFDSVLNVRVEGLVTNWLPLLSGEEYEIDVPNRQDIGQRRDTPLVISWDAQPGVTALLAFYSTENVKD